MMDSIDRAVFAFIAVIILAMAYSIMLLIYAVSLLVGN